MNDDQMLLPIAEDRSAVVDRISATVEEFLDRVEGASPLGIPHGRDSIRLELLRAHADEAVLVTTLDRMESVIGEDPNQAVFRTLSEFLRSANSRINLWSSDHAASVLTTPALTLLLRTGYPLAPMDGVRLTAYLITALGGHPEGRDAAVPFTAEEARTVVRLCRSVARPSENSVHVGDVILSLGLPRMLRLVRQNPVLSHMPVEWVSELVLEELRDARESGSALSTAVVHAGFLDG
jgi:hypothetical protein